MPRKTSTNAEDENHPKGDENHPKEVEEQEPLPPTNLPTKTEKLVAIEEEIQTIYPQVFYQGRGIKTCPTCGDKRHSGLWGEPICSQSQKPKNCWVK